ncbi:hypothetical protein AMB3_0588 [plant metagenome]
MPAMPLLSLRALIACLALLGATSALAARTSPAFMWLGSISAPQEYPVEVYEGALIADGYSYPFSPIWGLIHGGWGQPGGVMSLGARPQALPHTLRITWYAVKEKVFYTGEWPLDTASLNARWEAARPNPRTGKRSPYTSLLVGLGPAGKVVLWAHGSVSQVQVGSFRAQATTLTQEDAREDFQFFFRDAYRHTVHAERELYAPALLARLKKEGWPDPARYDAYETRYPWQIDGSRLGRQGPIRLLYQAFNGDLDIRVPQALETAPAPRPLPRRIQAVWHDPEGKEWVMDMHLAFEDIKAAMDAQDGATDIRLRIETHPDGPRLYAVSARQALQVRLQHVDVVTD